VGNNTRGERMPKATADIIQFATGPYLVVKGTVSNVVPFIRFRHYKHAELEIAKRFIRQLKITGEWYFDVYLETEMSKWIREKAEPINIRDIVPWLKRIDGICFAKDGIHIVEFKERLNSTLIGELIVYERMYKEQYQPKEPVYLDAVVAVDDPTLHPDILRNHIKLYVV